MNTRQADRIEVTAQASVRRGAGLANTVGVADLTPYGCRLVDIPRNLSRSEMISLRIAGVGPLLAHVRWLRLGREAGLEFDRPLDERLHAIIVGQNRLTPAEPYRAEIMELHNRYHDDPGEAQTDAGENGSPGADADLPSPDAAPAALCAAPDPDPVDMRHAARIAAENDPAMAVDAEHGPVAVRILDFSQAGLRIGHAGIRATAGSHLTLVFPDNQVVTGEVRWNNGSSLGIRVTDLAERPIPANDEPAVPENYLRDPPVAEPELEAADNGPAETDTEVDLPRRDLAERPYHCVANDIPTRFASLLEAARALDFVTVTVRSDGNQVTMELTMRSPG